MTSKPLSAALDISSCLAAILCGVHLTFWAAASLQGLCGPLAAALLGPLFLFLCIRLATVSLHTLRTTNRRRLPWRRHPAVGRPAGVPPAGPIRNP